MTAAGPPWTPLDFEALRATRLEDRPSKVRVEDFGRAWEPGGSLADFLDRLPGLLAAAELRRAVKSVGEAVKRGSTVLLGMGAHPVKVGLNPVLVDALQRGIFTGLAFNVACVIHDVELALAGKTSEDVASQLDGGCFGAAAETAEFIHGAVARAFEEGGKGLGQAVGERLLAQEAPYRELSLLATAARLGVPVTVHVALGTDIVHMHPGMDGAATGALSHRDFRLFCRLVSTLAQGVYINLGSAVVLPEVFLKAFSVARNLGFPLDRLTTIDMDFQNQYRSRVNVVERPVRGTGKGIALVGHHEIMFPLLMAGVVEWLEREIMQVGPR